MKEPELQDSNQDNVKEQYEAQLQAESDSDSNTNLRQTEVAGREPGNVNMSNNQQTCTHDIHAALREMSGLLAGLKVEVKYLKRENQEQAAKLRELELQKMDLKQQYQEQAAKVKELELQKPEFNNLKQQYQAQAGELLTIKALANTTENQLKCLQREGQGELLTIKALANTTEKQVESLQKEGQVKQVAFSASLLASGEGYTGPFNTNTNLVFKKVVTNIGNAYNADTGLFTAPVRGAYHFEFHFYGHGTPSPGSGGVLVKNGEQFFNSYQRQSSGCLNSSNGVTLLLEVGDVVFLRQWANTRIYDNENCHTTFSGHLLFIM